jgi:ribulose-5-phosphate 4-epimerase/fuculose-1-phosphate aldolase
MKITSEAEIRKALAALYAIFDYYDWTDTIDTHITARVPDDPSLYLIAPYGPLFDEITASSFSKVKIHDDVEDVSHTYNARGHAIHTAVYKARPDIQFIAHTHTREGIAASTNPRGLLPISQHAISLQGLLGYHDYGDSLIEGSEQHLVDDLADHKVLILRNHGLLTVARTPGELFGLHHTLELACKIQIDALAGGTEPIFPDKTKFGHVPHWFKTDDDVVFAPYWEAVLRIVTRLYPHYTK